MLDFFSQIMPLMPLMPLKPAFAVLIRQVLPNYAAKRLPLMPLKINKKGTK